MKHTTVIIPARYESQRFPGKILYPILGKPLILHVIEQIRGAEVDDILVATDSDEIRQVVASSTDCQIVMTRSDHRCGTDRIAEVAEILNSKFILNVQGDELVAGPQMINDILTYATEDLKVGALYANFGSSEDISDVNIVKVLVNRMGHIPYMSRTVIPFNRGDYNAPVRYYKQVGLYLFERETLLAFSKLEPSYLESMEGIELLRAVDHGIPLTGMYTEQATCDVNIPTDVDSAELFIKSHAITKPKYHV